MSIKIRGWFSLSLVVLFLGMGCGSKSSFNETGFNSLASTSLNSTLALTSASTSGANPVQIGTITVLSPNGSGALRIGALQKIIFTHSLGAGKTMNLDVTRDGGATWESIGALKTTSPSYGSFDWIVSGPSTAHARIRVSLSDNFSIFDTSDVDFSIMPAMITVTSPNGTGTLFEGSNFTVNFTHNLGTNQNINIDVSRDAGATWNAIANIVTTNPVSGSFLWQVTGPDTAQALIRVSSGTNSAVSDFSDHLFTIRQNLPAPIPSIDSASVGRNTKSTSIELGFSADQPANFLCSLDQSQFANCNSPISIKNLVDGVHDFAVVATNINGTTPNPVHFVWTVKTSLPTLNFSEIVPKENPSNVNHRSFYFVGSIDAIAYKCNLDDQPEVDCQSPFYTDGLSDGDHNAVIKAIDIAGNMSLPISSQFTIDTVNPIVSISSTSPNLLPTRSRQMSIAFVSADADQFECILDSGIPNSCLGSVDYADLSEGHHEFDVYAIDEAGNKSTSPAHFAWDIDLTPPEVTFISAIPAATVHNQTSTSIKFSLNELMSTVSCSVDSNSPVNCIAGNVTFSNLTNGPHQIQVLATDLAGNKGLPFNYDFVVDSISPRAKIDLTIPQSNPTNSTKISILFSSDKPSTFNCYLDNNVLETCSSPENLSDIAEGSHTFSVKATDGVGNQSDLASYSWVVDKTEPISQIVSHNPVATLNNSTSMTINFTSNENSTFECSLDGKVSTACTSPKVYSDLVEGSHFVIIKATDTAQNKEAQGATFFWTTDLTAPDTIITSTNPNESPSTLTTFTAAFTGTENSSFECQLDSADFIPCTNPVNYDNLQVGTHSFQVRAIDLAGNIDPSPAQFRWTVIYQPLIAFNFRITNITQTSAKLSWNTTVASSSRGGYLVNPPQECSGKTQSDKCKYTFTDPIDAPVTTHVIVLTNLASNNFYNVYGESVDPNAQVAQTTVLTFRTLK